ncbi:MAG: hypothetical protein IJ409_02320 [Lachnospiraceae bacterium]|nr:hypothetical protein [Lachnospiraceae bacterium]
MFGYIIINKGDMKFKEFDVYHSYYCGLCQSLKERHGLSGQLTLSYDLTFLVMLLSSLYEPDTEEDEVKCIAHPFERHPVKKNCFTEYCSDMNVLFSYYKCMDDWKDEKKVSRLACGKLLKKSYSKICSRYGEKAKKIDSLMRELSLQENKKNCDIDYMSGVFGEIMSEIFAYRKDEWEDELRAVGNYLGKFIYLMDAYEDLEEDMKKGRYNPFSSRCENPDFEEEVRTILTMMMAECSKEFEKLPVIDNVEILRNILYSGVWSRYEYLQKKKEEGAGVKNA